jgi:hypothetical protein
MLLLRILRAPAFKYRPYRKYRPPSTLISMLSSALIYIYVVRSLALVYLINHRLECEILFGFMPLYCPLYCHVYIV